MVINKTAGGRMVAQSLSGINPNVKNFKLMLEPEIITF